MNRYTDVSTKIMKWPTDSKQRTLFHVEASQLLLFLLETKFLLLDIGIGSYLEIVML